MLEEIEGKGYFKYLALVSLSASMSALDFIYMSLAYLVQKPVYQCLSADGQSWNVCEEDEICSSPGGRDSAGWRIDW